MNIYTLRYPVFHSSQGIIMGKLITGSYQELVSRAQEIMSTLKNENELNLIHYTVTNR